MSLFSAKSRAVMEAASRSFLEPPDDDEPDFLSMKPRGFCPWDGRKLVALAWRPFCTCHNWQDDDTEDENRIRYAAQMLDNDRAEGRMGLADY